MYIYRYIDVHTHMYIYIEERGGTSTVEAWWALMPTPTS